MRAVSKIIIAALVVAVVAAAAGALMVLPAQQQEARVFYVVAYHWGFAFYDEDLNEVPRITVKSGETVKIYVIPSVVFSDDFVSRLERRTLEKGIGGLSPGDPKILEEIKATKEGGLLDHGFLIQGYGQQVFTNHKEFTTKASSLRELLEKEREEVLEAHSIEFRADKPGSYMVICTVVCGYGHAWMIVEDGFVVEG